MGCSVLLLYGLLLSIIIIQLSTKCFNFYFSNDRYIHDEVKSLMWRQSGEQLRRKLQELLPEKGDEEETDCRLSLEDFMTAVSPSRSFFAYFFPLQSCTDNNTDTFDATAEEDSNLDIPLITDLLRPFMTNRISLMFSIALNDTLNLDKNNLEDALTLGTLELFISTFSDDGNGSESGFLRFHGGSILEREKRVYKYEKTWEMVHDGTDIKERMVFPPASDTYTWWTVTISYKTYIEIVGEVALIEETNPNTLNDINKKISKVVQDSIQTKKLVSYFIEQGLEVVGIAMVGNENEYHTRLAEGIGTAKLNEVNRSGTYPLKIDPYKWDFRRYFGCWMFVGTLLYVAIIYLLARKRKGLQRELKGWQIRLTEGDLNQVLKYGYKIDKGGTMVIGEYGDRFGYNDDSSMLIGETQDCFETKIITPETILATKKNDLLLNDSTLLEGAHYAASVYDETVSGESETMYSGNYGASVYDATVSGESESSNSYLSHSFISTK